MIARSKALGSLVAAVAVVVACQSSNTDGPDGAAGTTSAGAGGSPPLGGANGHSGGGQAPTGGTTSTAGRGGGPAGAAGEPDADAGAGGEASGGAGAGGVSGHGGTSGSGGSISGDAGASGEAGSTGEGRREFAYVSAVLGGVSMASVDVASGTATLLPGSPINPSGHATAIAVDPSQTFLYVADERQHIDTYRILADGTLPALPNSSIATPDTLLTITLDPKGRFAYAGSREGKAIYAFRVDSASGALTAVGNPLLVGSPPDFSPPTYIAADPSGNFVYVSQSFERGLRGYRIDQTTGALAELAGSPFGATGLPAGDVLIGGAIVFKPSADFLYTSGGALNAFAIDPASGALALVDGSPFTLDIQSDPNAPNLAIDPRGQYIYATRFLLTNHISGFAINQTSGALQEVPGSPLTGSAPYSIAVEPSGRFVFVGIDAPQLGAYALARATGALRELGTSPFPFGGLEAKIAFATLP